MKQGRKITFEERVEIVTFTIANAKNDPAAVETYGVSDQQVFSWGRKFEKDGSQRLLDRRGKGLESKPNLTEEEKMSADMDAYIFFCNHEQFQERNNGLAPLEMRNKAVA